MKELIRVLKVQKSAAEAVVKIVDQEIARLEKAGATSEETNETTIGKGKGKTAPADDDQMEEVESPYAGKGKGGKGKSAPVEEETAEETSSDDDDMFGDDAEENNEPTLDDVRKVVKDFATKHGKEKALKLLGKFKVTSIPDIKKQDYAKVIELAKKHL